MRPSAARPGATNGAPGERVPASDDRATADALALTGECDVVELHVESFIWTRAFGYDLRYHHQPGPLWGRFWGQADLPRLRLGHIDAVFQSVATNPFRTVAGRRRATTRNLDRLATVIDSDPDSAVVSGVGEYRRAKAAGRLACFLGLQGGNAVGVDDVATLPDSVSRVTLLHLTPSRLGSPSAPGEGILPSRGLTAEGARFVEALVDRRILVDLAHANAATFWDAIDVHPDTQPPVVTHTGVRSAADSWRNIDDSQVRAVADRGGVVGIIYHWPFLGGRSLGAVVNHLERVIDVGGEDVAALGSDWDGMILPPAPLRSADGLPTLVDAMVAQGFAEARIRRILGGNALRVLADVRP